MKKAEPKLSVMEFDPTEHIKILKPWYYFKYGPKGELIKEKKPCMEGDHIHLYNYTGCYKVQKVTVYHIYIMKNRSLIPVEWQHFKCLKGNGTSVEAELKRSINYHLRSMDYHLGILNEVKKSTSDLVDVLTKELKGLRKV